MSMEDPVDATLLVAENERLRVECQIWRELLAEVRELAARIAPVIWQSQGTERARTLMAKPAAMEAEVDRVIEKSRAEAAAVAPEEAEGGETNAG